MATNLFDSKALVRNRHRANRLAEPALFLHQLAASQVSERLSEINRRFTKPAIITAFPQIWEKALPDAEIVVESDLLDLKESAHDLIIHALSLHWANDVVGQLIQCRRALKPDGLFLGITFGGQTLHELRIALAEAESNLSGGLSPRVAPMAELSDFGNLLTRAAFNLQVADCDTVPVTYRNFAALTADLRAMGEGNALSGRIRTFTSRRLFEAAERVYKQHYSTPDGRINATFDMVYLTGWAPSDTQPKPLRPGSAKTRLADALNTVELTPGEGEQD